MPQPLDIPCEREKAVTLNAPIDCIEVQLGSLTALGRDGHCAEGVAGETIDGAALRSPVVLMGKVVPTRVRVWYESEARAREGGA